MGKNKDELLRKVKALAERGTDGEREAAQEMLARLMKKYGVAEEELEEERRQVEFFSYSQETERRLLGQIMFAVTGESPCGCVGTYTGRPRKKLGVECTAAQKLEIELKYAFYKAAFEEDLEIFLSAFIQKNDIFPENTPTRREDELTPEQRRRSLKVSTLMLGMERHQLHKAITAGGKSNA